MSKLGLGPKQRAIFFEPSPDHVFMGGRNFLPCVVFVLLPENEK